MTMFATTNLILRLVFHCEPLQYRCEKNVFLLNENKLLKINYFMQDYISVFLKRQH